MSLQEQFNLPLVKELIFENDNLRKTENLDGTKIPDNKIEKITVPYVIKNKLLMKEGEFNGVYYPKEEILSKVEEANEKGLILDHLDTANQGTLAWVGQIMNAQWTTGADGEGLYGDLSVIDKGTAQKLAQGAKWGISPTIDFEKDETEGRLTGRDLQWKSFSFVINPAVRDTMLNTKKNKEGTMPENKEVKKYPYPQKADGELKKEDNKELSLDVDEETLSVLQAKDAELKELREFKENTDNVKKSELAASLTANEFLIGRLSEDEISDREKVLMEKSPEILSEISEVVGDHTELSAFSDFTKAFMKKNKGSTIAQAAKAWKAKEAKLEDEPKDDPKDEPAGEDDEPAGEETDKPIETQSLTGMPDISMNGKKTAELSDKAGIKVEDTDVGMFNFLASQGKGGAL